MQYGMYFNQSRCNGCFACVVACRDYYDLQDDAPCFIRIKTIEKGEYPDPYMAFFPVMCYHCGSPACIPACPENAINKSEKTGIVTVNTAACIGGKKCGLCLEACPYGIPEFDPSAEGVMRKCDLCESRWSEGRKPVCVEACPVLALDAGPLGTLIEKHGAVRDAEGYITVGDLSPSIVCKPRRDARNLPLVKETVVPRRRD